MTYLIGLTFLWGVCSALIAMLIAGVLAYDDTPLNFYFNWLHRWHDAGGWRGWVASPLGGCVKCFAGQVGFWSSALVTPLSLDAFTIFLHLFCASVAVLCAFAINKAYAWMNSRM